MSHPRSHIWDFDDKADKDTDAVAGNIAEFDANGNPVDSGISPNDIGAALPLASVSEAQDPTNSTTVLSPERGHELVRPYVNPKAMSQAINMTAAASGSNGIKVLNDDNINFGTGDFTLVWKGSLPDWSPSSTSYLAFKRRGGEGTFIGFVVGIRFTGVTAISLYNQGASFLEEILSTSAVSLSDNSVGEITIAVTRNPGGSGSVSFFEGENSLGTVSFTDNGATLDNTFELFVSGLPTTRSASTTQAAILYNRALDADDVAYLYKNGIDPADMWGSQTALTSGTLEIGKNYIIDTFETGDDFTNVGAASNEDGVEFTATDTAPTTWANGSSLRNTGATAAYLPENIQPVPGQWLDASSNKLHALMPAAGCTLMRPENTFRYEYILTWTASAAAQPICGSTQDPVITDNHFIERIITENQEETNLQNVSIGDESDAARYMASATPGTLNTPTKQTVAAATPDGTNYQLLATPAATATMTVKFIIEGIIL